MSSRVNSCVLVWLLKTACSPHAQGCSRWTAGLCGGSAGSLSSCWPRSRVWSRKCFLWTFYFQAWLPDQLMWKPSKCKSYTDFQGKKEAWFCFGTAWQPLASKVGWKIVLWPTVRKLLFLRFLQASERLLGCQQRRFTKGSARTSNSKLKRKVRY